MIRHTFDKKPIKSKFDHGFYFLFTKKGVACERTYTPKTNVPGKWREKIVRRAFLSEKLQLVHIVRFSCTKENRNENFENTRPKIDRK